MARLLLVEDDELVRRAYVRVLRPHAPQAVGTVEDAQRVFRRHRHERAIVDVRLGDGDGLELLSWMRRESPTVTVLMVTGETDRSLAERAFLLGAALVYKPASVDVLRRFASGGARGPTVDVAAELGARHRLSPRQAELLRCIARGIPRRALGSELAVEENTVKTMVRQVLEKTGASTVDELRCRMLELGATLAS